MMQYTIRGFLCSLLLDSSLPLFNHKVLSFFYKSLMIVISLPFAYIYGRFQSQI